MKVMMITKTVRILEEYEAPHYFDFLKANMGWDMPQVTEAFKEPKKVKDDGLAITTVFLKPLQ